MCSTKTCPTTGWTVWASRPPCTETRTAPGPCRRFTSTTVPRCTLTSTRTPPTPTPCLLVWAPPLTTLSREIKTLYTGRCTPSFRGETHSVGQACVQAWRGQLGWASGCKISLVQKKTQARCQGQQSVPVKSLRHTGTQTDAEALGRREAKRASLALLFFGIIWSVVLFSPVMSVACFYWVKDIAIFFVLGRLANLPLFQLFFDLNISETSSPIRRAFSTPKFSRLYSI